MLDSAAILIVQVIGVLSVFTWVLREHPEAQAIQAVVAIQSRRVVDP